LDIDSRIPFAQLFSQVDLIYFPSPLCQFAKSTLLFGYLATYAKLIKLAGLPKPLAKS